MARVTSLAHGGGQGWALAAAHLCGRREMGSFSLCLSFIRLTGETELPSAAPSQTASDPRDRTFVPSTGACWPAGSFGSVIPPPALLSQGPLTMKLGPRLATLPVSTHLRKNPPLRS